MLCVEEGSPYPALHRLEQAGQSAEWRTSDSSRRAKFYNLTTKGRKQLAEQRHCERVEGVTRVLRFAWGGIMGWIRRVANVFGCRDAAGPAWRATRVDPVTVPKG